MQYFQVIYSTRTVTESRRPTVSDWSNQLLTTNKCVQTAQVEEGGKDEVHTLSCQARGELTCLWYAYRNALAAHVLLHNQFGENKDDRNRLNFARKTIYCLVIK